MVSRSMSTGVLRTLLFLSLVLCAIPLFAQQTGAIIGKVTASDGSALPGVTVEARSDVLPDARGRPSAARTASTGCPRCRRAPTRSSSTSPACRA